MVAVSSGHALRSLLKLVTLALAILVFIQVFDRVKREQPAGSKDVNTESVMAVLNSFNGDLHEMLRTVGQLTSVVNITAVRTVQLVLAQLNDIQVSSTTDVARRQIRSYLDVLQDCCLQLWDDVEALAINVEFTKHDLASNKPIVKQNLFYLEQFSKDLDGTIKNTACVSLINPVRRWPTAAGNNNFMVKLALLPLKRKVRLEQQRNLDELQIQLQNAWRDVKSTALEYDRSKRVAFAALRAIALD